eukprot:g7347.t1
MSTAQQSRVGERVEVGGVVGGADLELDRLAAFYRQHDPSKVQDAKVILAQYPREELLAALQSKYGAVPALAAGGPAESQPLLGDVRRQSTLHRQGSLSEHAGGQVGPRGLAALSTGGGGHHDVEGDGLVAALEIDGSGQSECFTRFAACPWEKWNAAARAADAVSDKVAGGPGSGAGARATAAEKEALCEAQRALTVWIHVDYENARAQRWLTGQGERDAQIGRTTAEMMIDMSSTPCLRSSKRFVYLSLRGINFNDGMQQEDMVNLHILVTPGRVLSTRHNFVRAVQRVRTQLMDPQLTGPRTAGQAVAEIVFGLIHGMRDPVERLELQLAEFEHRSLADDVKPSVLRRQLNELRRRIISLVRYILPQSHALEDLKQCLKEHADIFDASATGTLERTATLQNGVLRRLQALADRCKVVESDLAAQLQQKLNSTLFILTIVSAASVPPSFLMGALSIIPSTGQDVLEPGLLGQQMLLWLAVIVLFFLTLLLVASKFPEYIRG